jgi:hypothetical protein
MIHSELFGLLPLGGVGRLLSPLSREKWLVGFLELPLRTLLPAFKLPLPFLHFFISVLPYCDCYVDHVIEVHMLR